MTVIVDLTAFDAGIVVRCVPGPPSTGLAALIDAGHAVVQVSSVPGFVCRIGGRPGAATQACSTTPPATAYWSYWTATRGGSWTYSPVGAAASKPKQGAVEGWAFVQGQAATPPSVAPPALAPPTPATTPTAAPTARVTPIPTARSTPASSRAPAPAATAQPVTAAPSPATSLTLRATPAATSTPALADASEDPATQPTPTASPASAPGTIEAGGTGPLPTVVGLALVVAVAGSAVVMQRRARDPGHV
ncbi:MAG TPA: hypothetical protein VIZ22_01375 [Candidatus Limnocylindrales bacterium]